MSRKACYEVDDNYSVYGIVLLLTASLAFAVSDLEDDKAGREYPIFTCMPGYEIKSYKEKPYFLVCQGFRAGSAEEMRKVKKAAPYQNFLLTCNFCFIILRLQSGKSYKSSPYQSKILQP